MRPLSAFENFTEVARSNREVEIRSAVPETNAPVQQISRVFTFQSYFDNTLLERAILSQRPNNPIVDSTLRAEQIPGYSIGLHPSSQTPVAIEFTIGGQPSTSQAIVLRPGQIVRPHGLPRGVAKGAFSGFNWGLPFGWLGGGLATLLVFQTPDADVAWIGNAEVIFQRARYQILTPAALPANARKNWPLRFPWTQALMGSAAIPQQGIASISISDPTRIIMRLRLASLANPALMRIVFQETNDFDLDSAGAVIATPVSFVEHVWPAYPVSGGGGNLGTQYPLAELTLGPTSRLAADDGGIQLMDLSGGSLSEAYVDIVRYGRI